MDYTRYSLELLPQIAENLFPYNPNVREQFKKDGPGILKGIPEKWQFKVLSDMAWIDLQNQEDILNLEYTPEYLAQMEKEEGKEVVAFVIRAIPSYKARLEHTSQAAYYFFKNAATLLQAMPDQYEPYLDLGIRMTHYDPESAMNFFKDGIKHLERIPKGRLPEILSTANELSHDPMNRNLTYAFLMGAPPMLELFPEHYEQYVRISKQMAIHGDSSYFLKEASKILKTIDKKEVPRVLDYTERRAEKHAWASYHLFEKSSRILELLPDQYETFNDLTLTLFQTEGQSMDGILNEIHSPQLKENMKHLIKHGIMTTVVLSQLANVSKENRHRIIEGAKRLSEKNMEQGTEFLLSLGPLIQKLEASRPYIPDELLIEHMHDQVSAEIVSGIIDMNAYGKQYDLKKRGLGL